MYQKILNGEKIYIHSYSDKKTSGTRFYIHVRNIAAMAQIIAKFIGNPLHYEMVDFHNDSPGHDLQYGLDGSKLFKIGFQLPLNLEESLKKWNGL